MQIIGIILWAIGVLYAIAWGFIIRQKAKNEQATEHTFELHALLLAVSVIIIPVLSLSPFHLLWMLPASFVIGLASMMFPLNLLWFPASLYGSLWYVGATNPGRAFYLAGDYAKAIECYKESVRLKPNCAEAHFNLGFSYRDLGDNEKAIESFKEAIRIRPDYAKAHYNLGTAYRELGRHQEAIEAYKQALRIEPDVADVHCGLGIAYGKLGRYQEAIEAYKQAIIIEPDQYLYYRLAAVYDKLGHHQESLEAYKQATRIKPDDASAHFCLGAAYLAIGDKGSALEEYKILKTLDTKLANGLFNDIYQ